MLRNLRIETRAVARIVERVMASRLVHRPMNRPILQPRRPVSTKRPWNVVTSVLAVWARHRQWQIESCIGDAVSRNAGNAGETHYIR